jgi:alpha-amylase
MNRYLRLTLTLLSFVFLLSSSAQNPWNGKVVVQGFYWDYWNSEYPHQWSNYLAELAPRLRELGVDAIWIPPTYKNANQNSVGYAPFDHYDLGDKYQKGFVNTAMGDKDHLLRMIAVMHANGIEVIQDITLNHVTDAGSQFGSGGQDFFAYQNFDDGSTNGYKNFRYVCYDTPVGGVFASDYLSRQGRWPKNYTNFYPNNSNVCCTNEINSPYWGPDISYESDAFGPSSCINCFNPPQYENYMRTEARNWMIWYKKQTGVDGYRFDAVKHFAADVVEDFLWNTQYNAGFASGGGQMFAVGELVGGGSQLDDWANATQNRAGTFDFGLRGAIKDMITSGGFYNLGNIPSAQQNNRTRTVPFINLHDTFRPQVNAQGAYVGWDTFNELGGHIDPNDPRLEAAYAITFAVDGSPMVFFEDLFKLDTPNRFDNDPTSTTELPVRGAIENIMWCHQKLDFKAGAYKVRNSAADHLIIERSAKAIIGVNDNWNTWQHQWIPTDFAPGTVLKDYSGANAYQRTVNQDGWVEISTPPCNGTNVRRGYTIWGPVGIGPGFSPPKIETTQEWQMVEDLGDSHPFSLQQGGAIPSNSTDTRTAGKIFAKANTNVKVRLLTQNRQSDMTLIIANATGEVHLDSINGTGFLNYQRRVPITGWYTIKVRNTFDSNPINRALVRATYEAPRVVNTFGFPKDADAEVVVFSEQDELVLFPNPVDDMLQIEWAGKSDGGLTVRVMDLQGRVLINEQKDLYRERMNLDTTSLPAGVYLLTMDDGLHSETKRFIKR